MTQIINGGTPAVVANTMKIMLIDSNGDSIDTLGSGTSGGSGVTGPTSATNLGIAIFSGTAGQTIQNSNFTISGDTFSSPGNVTINGNVGLGLSSIGTISLGSSNDIVSISSSGQTIINSTSANISLDAKTNLVLAAAYAGGTGSIQLNGDSVSTFTNIVPSSSGSFALGTPALQFSGVYANQYATSLFNNGTGTAITVNWNNGSAQQIDFTGQVSGTATITLSNGIPGSTYSLQTKNNAGGTISVAWGANQIWAGASTGTSTLTAGAIDLFTFYYNGTKYLSGYTNSFA